MKNKKRNLILIGGGGHCVSAIDIIEQENKFNIIGIIDVSVKKNNVLGYPIIGDDKSITKFINKNTYFLITIGQIKSYSNRKEISNILDKNNANLATVISPRAYVSRHSIIKPGTIVMHDAIVNSNVQIGRHCIINTKSNIEHDVIVKDFCHISTCAVVNGNCVIGRGSFVGSNATITMVI